MGPGQDFAIFRHQHGPHRNLPRPQGPLGFLQSFSHEAVIRIQAHGSIPLLPRLPRAPGPAASDFYFQGKAQEGANKDQKT